MPVFIPGDGKIDASLCNILNKLKDPHEKSLPPDLKNWRFHEKLELETEHKIITNHFENCTLNVNKKENSLFVIHPTNKKINSRRNRQSCNSLHSVNCAAIKRIKVTETSDNDKTETNELSKGSLNIELIDGHAKTVNLSDNPLIDSYANANASKRKFSKLSITKPFSFNLKSKLAAPVEKRSKHLLPSTMSLHEYRLHSVNSEKSENNISIHTMKPDNVEDDNIIKTVYLQRILGGSNTSIATLCNIGNSCYLNSVIYTLRFAPCFLHKLHHLVDDMRTVYMKLGGNNKLKSSSLGRNTNGMHLQNGRSVSSKDFKDLASMNGSGSSSYMKSNRQIATEKLHELYQSLYRNESVDSSEPFHAGTFLQSIQEVSSIFEGNQQQDAHELLMCILDSIRETCSTIIKIIEENPDVITDNNTASTHIVEKNEIPITNHIAAIPAATQSLKSIFTRNKKRKEMLKINNDRNNSPFKEIHGDVHTGVIDTSKINDSNEIPNSGVFSNGTVNLTSKDITDNGESSSAVNVTDKEKVNETIKKLGLDFFREDFEGITLSTTKCLTCETVTEQKETMIDISIPISANDNSPLDPQLFFQNSCITREYFRVENQYRCDKCCGYTEAIRSISFEVLPRLLVLHIKRFSGGMEKISSYSPTPFLLKCFCNKCHKKKDEEKMHVYKLYSVITHVGATMSVGHYIAYTCSLDIYNDYLTCANMNRRLSSTSLQNASTNAIGNSVSNNNGNFHNNNNNNNGMNNNNTTVTTEKNTGLMKKLIYGRNKASSSGDMSKSLRPINGISKSMINRIEKFGINSSNSNSSNTGNNINGNSNSNSSTITSSVMNNNYCNNINSGNSNKLNNTSIGSFPRGICTSANCCGIYIKKGFIENGINNSVICTNESNSNESGVLPSIITINENHRNENAEFPNSNSSSSSNNNNNNNNPANNGVANSFNKSPLSNLNQNIWYMCDDDKIKMMPQKEFEEMLSRNQKVLITPYLLFYARYDQNVQNN